MIGKIHEALADGTLHADMAKVLEEMAETLSESFLRRSLETGSEAPVAQAAPQANVEVAIVNWQWHAEIRNVSVCLCGVTTLKMFLRSACFIKATVTGEE